MIYDGYWLCTTSFGQAPSMLVHHGRLKPHDDPDDSSTPRQTQNFKPHEDDDDDDDPGVDFSALVFPTNARNSLKDLNILCSLPLDFLAIDLGRGPSTVIRCHG